MSQSPQPSLNQSYPPSAMPDPLDPATYPSTPGGMNRLPVFCRKYSNTNIQTTESTLEATELNRFIPTMTVSSTSFRPSYHLSASPQGGGPPHANPRIEQLLQATKSLRQYPEPLPEVTPESTQARAPQQRPAYLMSWSVDPSSSYGIR